MEILFQNEYFIALLIPIAALAAAKIFNTVAISVIRKATSRFKGDLNDRLIRIVKRPITYFMFFAGIYFSIKTLSYFDTYAFWIDRVYFVGAVILSAKAVSGISSVFVSMMLRARKKVDEAPRLFNKITAIVVYLVAILIILDNFSIKITPIIATLGIGGIAIGLALQKTLSDFFAGLQIVTDRPINVKDFIELNEGKVSGYVEDIGWRSTRIRTLKNAIIIIPNSVLAETIIVNNTLTEKELSITIDCGVSYNDDLEKVEKVTLEVAKEIQKKIEGAKKDFEPILRYKEFGDSNINFIVILRVENNEGRYIVQHEFIKALKKRYDKEGIEISWPVRKIVNK